MEVNKITFSEYILSELEKVNDIELSVKQFFLSQKPGIIYGAGNQARLLVDLSFFFNKRIKCLLVSDTGKRTNTLLDSYVLYKISDFPATIDRNTDVIIAVNEKSNEEIKNTLYNHNFTNIFYSNNWIDTSEKIRNFFYEKYFFYHGFTTNYDLTGMRFLQYKNDVLLFKLCFPLDNGLFRSNISGELNDIVLPSLIGDFNYLLEGAYEYENISLSGGVVFDLGANIGLFTAVAAAKNCHVYAFEPTPSTLPYLEKNASFYPGKVTICPYAISNKKGIVRFYINNNFLFDKNTGSNNMFSSYAGKFAESEVLSTTLDDFVSENNIKNVDFIKADIEGSERLMLQGAQEVLSQYSPKLALCTYHLPDDPIVMEKLILKANPNYVIIHKWLKLFAYCP
jgi:FkbM family methyltransferase